MVVVYHTSTVIIHNLEDEDGVEEENEHEWPPRHKTSKNIVQAARGQAAGSNATAKGRNIVRGRIRKKRAMRPRHK